MCFELLILGSNSAQPSINRFTSSQVLTIANELFMIDCGEGTQIRSSQFKVKLSNLENIFISHLHGDHYYGIFGLLSSLKLQGREKKLNIYADKNLSDMLLSEFSPVIIDELGYDVIFHSLPDNNAVIFESKSVIVECFPLHHKLKTMGFIFKEKEKQPNIRKEKITELDLSIDQILKLKNGNDIVINNKLYKNSELTINPPKTRSYAYCSDTKFDRSIIGYVAGADLLYHEATYSKKDSDLANKYFHSTSEGAANIAKLSNVKKLVIGHFSSRYVDLSVLLNEAKNIFDNTILAYDGLRLKVPLPIND